MNHRDAYPEQYTHPLVGRKVRTKNGIEGTVLRVMDTQFGKLADLGTTTDDGAPMAYGVWTLEVIE